jgi:8-oxo-dGTP diphosphatase
MSTPIAVAVVEHEGQFLIGQRPTGAPLAGLWEFPGGKMQLGESPEAAAIRECLEETGLDVELLFHYPTCAETYDHDRVELHFVACRLVAGSSISPREPFCWVPRAKLPDYEFPLGNRHLLSLLCKPQIALGDSARLR